MTMMEEIMENLGVELNEVFCIRVHGSKLNGFRFIEKGPKDIVFEDIQNRGYDYFYDLLNGEVRIIKKPYRPAADEIYYYVDNNLYVRSTSYISGFYTDTFRVLLGNCYKSEEEAEQHIDYWKRIYKDMPEFKEVEK
jgi:hypothetical protein